LIGANLSTKWANLVWFVSILTNQPSKQEDNVVVCAVETNARGSGGPMLATRVKMTELPRRIMWGLLDFVYGTLKVPKTAFFPAVFKWQSNARHLRNWIGMVSWHFFLIDHGIFWKNGRVN
jgi:hypothetical protein